MKKAIYFVFLLSFIFLLFFVFSSAHSGRTDGSGGHYNHSTGEYHYHHGKPAHDHPNGVCPYAQSNNNSNNSYNDSDFELSFGSVLLIIGFAFCLLITGIAFLASAIIISLLDIIISRVFYFDLDLSSLYFVFTISISLIISTIYYAKDQCVPGVIFIIVVSVIVGIIVKKAQRNSEEKVMQSNSSDAMSLLDSIWHKAKNKKIYKDYLKIRSIVEEAEKENRCKAGTIDFFMLFSCSFCLTFEYDKRFKNYDIDDVSRSVMSVLLHNGFINNKCHIKIKKVVSSEKRIFKKTLKELRRYRRIV